MPSNTTEPIVAHLCSSRTGQTCWRNARFARSGAAASLVRYGDLHLNRDTHKGWVGRDSVEFQPKEFELLQYLLKHEGKLIRREVLCKAVWGYDYHGSTRTVDMHIAKLRKKLTPSRALTIKTLKREGYRLDLKD